MLALKWERPASQIFNRTQLWQCGDGEALVSFGKDEGCCSIFLSKAPHGVLTEILFNRLGLSSRPDFSLDPSIDCYSIGCPREDAQSVLESMAPHMTERR